VTWLVTGGAGYIGAAVVRALTGDGRPVVVLDDLSAGDPDSVPAGVPLVRASVADVAVVRRVLDDHAVTGVIHLAGRKSVAESVARPVSYYRHNVGGTLALLEAMTDAGVRQLVFSSSAAVYGAPTARRVGEDARVEPSNPYGATKLVGEWIVAEAARVHGLRSVILRCFNVAGAVPNGRPCAGGTGLLHRAVEAVSRGARPVVYGRDYPTPDGSCVRDFVHVLDVAAAHARAAQALAAGQAGGVYNVGCGLDFSVQQVLDRIRQVTGVAFEDETGERRNGDPARVVASIDRIRRELGWQPRYDLSDMVRSEWEARLTGPDRAHAPPPGPVRHRQRAAVPVPAPARVVVISASVGAGHDGAARELAGRLGRRGLPVAQVDLLSVFPGRSGTLLREAYHTIIDRQPWIYGGLFLLACRCPGAAPVTRALLRPMRRRLLRLLPADTGAVVSTFPLGAQILGPLRRHGRLRVPLVTYLTDFAVHPLWVAPGVDLHCAAHEVSRQQAYRLGAAGVHVSGRLASVLFQPGSAALRRQARQQLGLPPLGRLALLVAGSWGVGEVEAAALDVARTGAAMPVVVCGRNPALIRRLRARGLHYVYGWVDDMPGLLHAVDVLVENAGGLTAVEAMACGVPVLTYRPIAGHGFANAASMARAGVAYWVRTRESLGPALVELIDGPLGRWQRQAGLALFERDPATVVAGIINGARAGSRRGRGGDVAA
jgi:processive 1,2-diacylglycerol beta-glucosyltransferase